MQYRKPNYKLGRYYAHSKAFDTDEFGEPTSKAKMTTLQSCPSKLRPALIGKIGHDVDIENSIPTIALQYLTKNRELLGGIADAVLAPLHEYVNDRTHGLARESCAAAQD